MRNGFSGVFVRTSFFCAFFCLAQIAWSQTPYETNASDRQATVRSYYEVEPYGTSDEPAESEPADGSFAAQEATRYRSDQSRDFVHLPDYDSSGEYRQPTCMVAAGDGSLIVATKLTGEILRVDPNSGEVARLFGPSARQFESLIAIDNGVWAVADNAAECIVGLRFEDSADDQPARLEEVFSISAPGTVADLLWDADNQRLLASSIWARRILAWELPDAAKCIDEKCASNVTSRSLIELAPIQLAPIELDWSPGVLTLAADRNTIFVAGAFGGQLGMIDREGLELGREYELFDHNIKAMHYDKSSGQLSYAHQLLNEFIPAVRGEITWGGMLTNSLRTISASALDDALDIYHRNKFMPVGFTGQGGGQPTDFRMTSDGRLLVTLGGSSKLAIQTEQPFEFDYYATGLYPVACVLSKDETQVYVLNQFSDSLTVVDRAAGESRQINLGPVREPTIVERGEQLFHDSRLSHDGWMSCESCHSRGHTNGKLNDNLTDGHQGTPKRVLSLLGQSETAPYGWNASQPTLEDQVRHSIKSTMASDHSVREEHVRAIAAYVRSLLSPPPQHLAVLTPAQRTDQQTTQPFSESGLQGRLVFERLRCNSCHQGERLTHQRTFDVGLVDEVGTRRFNPPSLRGVGQREAVLLHNGSARQLEEVFSIGRHKLSEDDVSDSEFADLLQYLREL